MEDMHLTPGATPFYYPGNRIGCLVTHGFTGVPQEVRWLGQYLNQRGYTVHGPRLPGHGTAVEDMCDTRWREWYAAVLAGYAMLRAQCDKVFVMGLSMGGSLSLLLASREPVDGVVAMSAPYEVQDWRRSIAPILSPFIRTIPKKRPHKDAFDERVRAEQRTRGEEEIGHFSYSVYPIRPALQLFRLLSEMRAGLPRITAPALLIHSRQDDTVPFTNLQKIYDAVGSVEKHMLVLEDSLHVITEDHEREKVFAAAADFVARHA
jgi:carboxylesterase